MSTHEHFTFPLPTLRLGEFDMGGVLYHANYFHVYEMAREAFLSAGGSSYPSLVSQGQHLAVVESHQEFLKPVRYGHPLTVRLRTENVRRATTEFIYEIFSGEIFSDHEAPPGLVHRGRTKHVLVTLRDSAFEVTGFPDTLAEYFRRFSGHV